MNTVAIPQEALAWVSGGDTGLSSKVIWRVLLGQPPGEPLWGVSHPHDPSDFGRCHRLLWTVPGWRHRIGEMASVNPVWARLVAAWDELEQLWTEEYPTGDCPRLYARMKELGA